MKEGDEKAKQMNEFERVKIERKRGTDNGILVLWVQCQRRKCESRPVLQSEVTFSQSQYYNNIMGFFLSFSDGTIPNFLKIETKLFLHLNSPPFSARITLYYTYILYIHDHQFCFCFALHSWQPIAIIMDSLASFFKGKKKIVFWVLVKYWRF